MNKNFNQYLNIDKRTLELVYKLINNGYFKKGFNQKFLMLIELNKQLSKVYKIKKIPLKIIPYNKIKYNYYNKSCIEIGDCLSLVSFLAKFNLHLDNNKNGMDYNEVKLDRDCLDWSLSVIKFSDEIIMERIIKSIEKNMLSETVTT